MPCHAYTIYLQCVNGDVVALSVWHCIEFARVCSYMLYLDARQSLRTRVAHRAAICVRASIHWRVCCLYVTRINSAILFLAQPRCEQSVKLIGEAEYKYVSQSVNCVRMLRYGMDSPILNQNVLNIKNIYISYQ